ncbi:KdsC family phosphatase [Pseudalkalibacillus hwajinpoensis]|uniref:KdsC family phosphatase n=1 Tax=Guptibacillus hwajinpoensis TaxID=208199 RepID=UPI001CFEB73E|nr:HAD-IIIA family hydrolase [Pseudalkalibacillus hwajinpoensis]
MKSQIKLIVLDVDGVLTDGNLLIGSDGIEYKGFNTQDGMGISLARYTGIKIAIITGRISKAVEKRASELSIDFLYQGIHHKVECLEEMISELGIQLENVCYVGDDLNDIPILNIVGFPCAPSNAVESVKRRSKYISSTQGGYGAVREIVDYILEEQYNYDQLIEEFVGRKNELKQ